MLQEALLAAAGAVSTAELDCELAIFATSRGLATLAAHGMRGELAFATPLVLRTNPRLLGYYRMLLGYSQKEFYNSATGLGAFKGLEERGALSLSCEQALPDLCKVLNDAADFLLTSLQPSSISKAFLDDLALLTLGPQLRGGANVKRGSESIVQVFQVLQRILGEYASEVSARRIRVRNDSNRDVYIEFASDPDIVIREQLSEDTPNFRCIVAIEVKGGADFSNIHNRLGEAEKSHQKARASGYVECWTIINVSNLTQAAAQRASPSTNRVYQLASIISQSGTEYDDFESRVRSLTGTSGPRQRRRSRRRE